MSNLFYCWGSCLKWLVAFREHMASYWFTRFHVSRKCFYVASLMLYSQVSYIGTNFLNYFYLWVLLLKVGNPYMPLTGHTRAPWTSSMSSKAYACLPLELILERSKTTWRVSPCPSTCTPTPSPFPLLLLFQNWTTLPALIISDVNQWWTCLAECVLIASKWTESYAGHYTPPPAPKDISSCLWISGLSESLWHKWKVITISEIKTLGSDTTFSITQTGC